MRASLLGSSGSAGTCCASAEPFGTPASIQTRRRSDDADTVERYLQ